MSFNLKSPKGGMAVRLETGIPSALGVLHDVSLKKQILPAVEVARTEKLPLTEERAADLRCEGRIAAFQGMSLRSCPYNVGSRAERDAWLEGYNTLK